MIKFKNLNHKLFYDCLRIREVEKFIIDKYPTDLIQSPVHLSIGQEAISVSLCNNLKSKDFIFSNYRGHAIYLAKGGSLKKLFAELMGRVNGISKGKAGSMHLSDKSNGMMGSSAIVASTIPHAVGAAFANSLEKNNSLNVAIFGDGAMEQGVFHESLNFASLKNLPVVFICENNNLAVHTLLKERQAFNIKNLINSYGIKFIHIKKGYDYFLLDKVFKKEFYNIRKNKNVKPIFVFIDTFRYKEHVGVNDDFDKGYRDISSFKKWQKNDPIANNKDLINKFTHIISKEIEAAFKYALNSKEPNYKELNTDVI